MTVKLTPEQRDAIRASTDSNQDLAARYGVSSNNIWRIRQTKPQHKRTCTYVVLTPKQRREIADSTERTSVLAKHYGVTPPSISNIRNGRVVQIAAPTPKPQSRHYQGNFEL